MARPTRRRPLSRLLLALALAATAALGLVPVAAPSSVAALSRWTGGIDLYRSGVFTTQKTWLWCTAADVQIIRNIVDHQTDHSRANQSLYFAYMRAHDRYWMPVSDGTEPSGWAAGLRHYVDSRYRMVASTSFDSALRSAVTNLRRTNLPVGLLVAHGDHAWVLTGFTATADPARTSHFTVTSVRVTGPLWGLQSRSYGYDMRPDTRLTPAQLRGFFTPWHYARIRMAWEGRWVSIQGIPVTASTAAVAKTAPVIGGGAASAATAHPASTAGLPSSAHPASTAGPASSPRPASTAHPASTAQVAVSPMPIAAATVAPAAGSRPAIAPVVESSAAPVPVTLLTPGASALPAWLGMAVAIVASAFVVSALGVAAFRTRSRRTVARG
jgi:hypothetical protein